MSTKYTEEKKITSKRDLNKLAKLPEYSTDGPASLFNINQTLNDQFNKNQLEEFDNASGANGPEAKAKQAKLYEDRAKRIAKRESEKREKDIAAAKEIQRTLTVGEDLKEIKGGRDRLNIDKLRYNFDQGARANRFTVDFYCPPLGIKLEGVRCSSASLPGRQLETADFSEYGPTRKIPFNTAHDGQEVSFQFICDSSFADRFIIEAWMGAIFTGTGESNTTDTGVSSTGYMGSGSSIQPTFLYYEDYIGEIVIKQITQQNKDSLVYRIFEAYPVSFAPMELSSENGDLMKFECTFAFRTWDSEYKNPNPVSGINKGRRVLDALLGIGNLRKGGNSGNSRLQRFQDRLGRLSGIFG